GARGRGRRRSRGSWRRRSAAPSVLARAAVVRARRPADRSPGGRVGPRRRRLRGILRRSRWDPAGSAEPWIGEKYTGGLPMIEDLAALQERIEELRQQIN